ncbi:alpha/beta hydrolase [Paraflavitalea sp. CAU 1676]|uniref:alpha/beta hydrolase n=1 Tax=Paraflavitalea sp. CAU 1676 TaxID=3032598 RepID=UPI0023DB431A|nr:alpha/beta hydrolase [Paraflavitalea sp. CAU 1676]MDF2191536.1 alpha/beta hydrolase [Paraflavitalea sp. CAU 1676]
MFRISLLLLLLSMAIAAGAQEFKLYVHLDTSAHQSLSGRLYVFSASDTSKGVQDPDAIHPTPSFYIDVRGWKGGTAQLFDSTCIGYPVAFSKLKPGPYKFGAVFDVDTTERSNTALAGNWYSRDVKVEVKPGNDVHLYLSRKFPQRAFNENDTVKLVSMQSALLSRFQQRDVFIKAGIVLPPDYGKDTSLHYPVVFVIPGWGGTHYDVLSKGPVKRYGMRLGKDKIYVYLNPETQTRYGLHAFVDSRVNGPWGKALVEELVPYLSTRFRIEVDRSKHFVVGQSSGGYAALWLQLNYPTSFGGCWAVSPDPVAFSNFIGVDIYAKRANLYYDKQRQEHPFFLENGKGTSTLKQFVLMEDFMGDGGQMQSFEAEFGLPDATGRPRLLFNRTTGAIDHAVVQSWKPYDLAWFVEANYKRLAKDLEGKVHVYAGAEDNFSLDKAVQLFKESSVKMKADFTVELLPGANHWSVWSEAFTQRVQREIDQRIK